MASIDLTSLPSPAVVEELDFEALFSAIKADFIARMPEIAPLLELESEPVTKLCQAFIYREMVLRARVNDAARANLLAFAGGSDLDHLAAFYDVVRLAGEDDARLRERVRLTIFGRSAGGPAERYKAVAMEADVRVRNVAIWRDGRDPTVRIAVLSTEADGVADQGLLNTVRAALEAPAVRVVSDRFEVASAVRKFVDVVLRVRLAPDAPQSVLDDLPAIIQEAWTAEALLGLDLTASWLVARAMRPGVSRVEVVAPAEDVVAAPTEAIALQSITIEDGGRGR